MSSLKHHHGHSDGHALSGAQADFIGTPAWLYDLMVLFGFRGQEKRYRQMIANLARLQPGEAVLDVGCGTGTLALVAKTCVGETGRVCGIDPSPGLLTGAQRKAARARLSIEFQSARIEQLPFPDQSFDVVLSTFMMHHLPDDLKRQGLSEIVRVLKPAGRLLVIDFATPNEHQEPFETEKIPFQALPSLMKEIGFSQTESGKTAITVKGLRAGHQDSGFVLAKKSL
jgi:ubiquinone/menaquinone biosynthesis C-methylase UbiE